MDINTCIHMVESLRCSPETTTTLLISCMSESHSAMSDSLQSYGLYPSRLLCPWDSPRKNTVHGILHARILERVAISFSRGSFRLRDQIRVSCMAGRFFTNEPPRKSIAVMKVIALLLSFQMKTYPSILKDSGSPGHCSISQH